MQPRRLPFRGVTNATGFRGQPADFAPFGHLLNFLPNVPGEDRMRGGQRAGLEKLSTARVSTGRAQALAALALASTVTGYTVDEDTCEDLTEGEDYDGAVVAGNAWMFDAGPAMFREFDLLGDDHDGSSNKAINAVCWDPDGEHAYCVQNYVQATGSLPATAIFKLNRDGTTTWSVEWTPLPSAGQANTIDTDGVFLFVTEQHRVAVFRCDTGAFVNAYNINGWANECIEARVRPDGRLLVAFRGSSVAGTLYNGEAILPNFGSDFRAGVALFDVSGDADDADPLTWRTFGPQLDNTDPWFETTGGATYPHGYFRMSEHLPGRPRGSTVEGLAVCPDNSVVVVRRNKSFGPNWDYPPSADVPFITVFKLDEDGNLLWAVDTDSKRDSHTIGGNTYQSDRWSTDPSLIAVIVGPEGDVYVAGDSHARAGANVFRLHPDTGAIIASVDLGDATPGNTIRQAAIDIMPQAGLVAVAGVRNSVWPDAGGANAHVWYLSPGLLEVVRWIDINDGTGVNASAIKFNEDDEAVVGTQHV